MSSSDAVLSISILMAPNVIIRSGQTHEVRNEVLSADLVLTSRISLFKEVEMIDCPEEMHSLASKEALFCLRSCNIWPV